MAFKKFADVESYEVLKGEDGEVVVNVRLQPKLENVNVSFAINPPAELPKP